MLKLSGEGNLCIAGDYNISFSGYPYPAKQTIEEARLFFEEIGVDILTKSVPGIPDHISITKDFLTGKNYKVEAKHFEPKLTDHSLVSVEIEL